MRKPLLATASAIILCLGALPIESFARSFPDTIYTRYSEAFTYLSEKGIAEGVSGRARPLDLLTRAEALKLALESDARHRATVAWFNGHMPQMPLFVDIDQRAWYAPYVEAGFQEGIIMGFADRTFHPNAAIKTEEAITLLLRAHETVSSKQKFQSTAAMENRNAEWFSDAVSAAIEKKLISDREVLRLGRPITRGQFADIVYRLHVVEAGNLVAYDRPEPVVALPPPQPRAVATAVAQPVRYQQTTQAPRATTAVTSDSNTYANAGALSEFGSDRFFSVTIPSLGIRDLIITHPTDPLSSAGVLAPLKHGVGHLFSYPGAGGKILVYGHSSGYPWDVSQYTKIFRTVNKLNKGDQVYVTYNGNLYVYEVSYENTVPAGDTSAYSGDGEELILYTCWPPDSISQRYLVHAFPVKTVALR